MKQKEIAYDDVEQIIRAAFPFVVERDKPGRGSHDTEIATELFGPRALEGLWEKDCFLYDETARWVFYNNPRFRTVEDAVLFKLAR